MKKYTYALLLSFSVLQLNCYGADDFSKPELNQIQTPLSMRLMQTIEYFEKEKEQSPLLQNLSRTLEKLSVDLPFIPFATSALKANQCLQSSQVVAGYIRIGAQRIIKTKYYNARNLSLFNLVEGLDPLYRTYIANNNNPQ